MPSVMNGGAIPQHVKAESCVTTSMSRLMTLEGIELNLTRSASQLLALQESIVTKPRADSTAKLNGVDPASKPLTGHSVPDTGDEGGGKSQRQIHICGKAALRNKIIKTIILYSGVFFLGLQWGIIGPSLPDLERLTGGSTGYISLILTGRNIAALAGSALAGFMIDRYNNWLLLGVSEAFLGVLFAAAPWGQDLVLLGVCMIPSGLAAGFYDTGVNVAVLRVWEGKPGPWIQAMECIDAIGSFVAPLLAQPFLLYKAPSQWEDGEDLYTNQSTHSNGYDNGQADERSLPYHLQNMSFSESQLLPINLTSYFQNELNLNSSEQWLDQNTTYYNPITVGHSNVMFAYLIVGLLMVCAALAHFAVLLKGKWDFKLNLKVQNEDTVRRSSLKSKQARRTRALILPLLFFICFAYYTLETGYAYYLMTFCVKHLNWDKSAGVAVTSAFWGAYTAGTAIGIVLIKFVQPRTLLIFDVVLCLSSQTVLTIFLHSHRAVVWVCTMLAGLSIATIFASVFSWAQKNIGVTGKVNALMMTGMSLGEMTLPAIMGILIDKSGAISWVYCMLSSAILCALVLVFMQLLATKLKRQRHSSDAKNDLSSNMGEIRPEIRLNDDITKELAHCDPLLLLGKEVQA